MTEQRSNPLGTALGIVGFILLLVGLGVVVAHRSPPPTPAPPSPPPPPKLHIPDLSADSPTPEQMESLIGIQPVLSSHSDELTLDLFRSSWFWFTDAGGKRILPAERSEVAALIYWIVDDHDYPLESIGFWWGPCGDCHYFTGYLYSRRIK